MKGHKQYYGLGVLALTVAVLLAMSGCRGGVSDPSSSPDIDYTAKHLKVSVKDEGYDVYTPYQETKWGYHYGPAILLNDDGSMDAWFASPGRLGEMDWFSWKHSEDGLTWSKEQISLYPTAGSLDQLSVCDPDVLRFGGYYYIGYTSTIDSTGGGLCNSAFVARAKDPQGPWEKWNGSGWGGDPWPVVYYEGRGSDWGCGEPSLVVVGDTLYIYHSMNCNDLDNQNTIRCHVYTADASDENWPATMQYQGVAVDYSPGTRDGYIYKDHDSLDVAYVETYKKFIAVGTNRRFGTDSCIVYYESNDGLTFTRVSELNANILAGCHNCGISKDGNGHIKEGDKVLLGYAYAGSDSDRWGFWATRFTEIEISVTDEADRSGDREQNVQKPVILAEPPESPHIIGISTSPHEYKRTAGKTMTIKLYAFDEMYNQEAVTDPSEVTFSGYDEELIRIDGFELTMLKEGETTVTVDYQGLRQEFSVVILPKGVRLNSGRQAVISLEPMVKDYTVSLSSKEAKQIRSLATFENRDFCELYNNPSNIDYPYSRYPVQCTSSDPAIASVGTDCVIYPQSIGDTMITVTCGDISYDIPVHVTE